MKNALILLVLAVGVQVMAQDNATITVKNSEVSNGVVIISGNPGADGRSGQVIAGIALQQRRQRLQSS